MSLRYNKLLKWGLPLFFISILYFQSCKTDVEYPRLASDDFLLGGILVDEPDYDKWVHTLDTVGMNTVSVTVYARHYEWNDYTMVWDKETNFIIEEIKKAKEKGLKVVLIPRVALDHYFEENRFLWHGMIMPEDTLIDEWFRDYTHFVNNWATIAEELNVDVFAIGSELRILTETKQITALPDLESYYLSELKQELYISDRMAYKDYIPTEHLWLRGENVTYNDLKKYLEDEVAKKVAWTKKTTYHDQPNSIELINKRRNLILKKWYDLIDTVRQSYSGKLTYAANFDNYQNIAFWDKLDFMGINAYFQLRERPKKQTDIEKYKEMEEAWKTHFKSILDFQLENKLEHPVLFTELGYIFRENCTVMPWEGFGFSIARSFQHRDLIIWPHQKENYMERALAIKALHQVNEEYGLLQGVLYWKLSTDPYHKHYEPFLMHISPEGTDPMQSELLKFVNVERRE